VIDRPLPQPAAAGPPGQHPRDSGKGIRLPVRIWRVP